MATPSERGISNRQADRRTRKALRAAERSQDIIDGLVTAVQNGAPVANYTKKEDPDPNILFGQPIIDKDALPEVVDNYVVSLKEQGVRKKDTNRLRRAIERVVFDGNPTRVLDAITRVQTIFQAPRKTQPQTT